MFTQRWFGQYTDTLWFFFITLKFYSEIQEITNVTCKNKIMLNNYLFEYITTQLQYFIQETEN